MAFLSLVVVFFYDVSGAARLVWGWVISAFAIAAIAGFIGFVLRPRSKPRSRSSLTNPALTDPAGSEQHYRALTELSPQIIWMADKDGYTNYFNQQWYDFTGLTVEESMGNGWSRVLHPDDRERCLLIWERAVLTDTPYEIEYLFRKADGTYRWHLGKGLPVRDKQGNIRNWFGICINIHDRRVAAAATGRIAERLQLAIEAGGIGTFDFYPDMGTLKWSDQCSSILGVQKTSAASLDELSQFVHNEDRTRLKRMLQRIETQSIPEQFDVEYRIVRPDGEMRWVAAKGRRFLERYDREIERVRVSGVVIDVTSRKQVENERLGLATHIEAARESERTHVAREIHDELGQTLTAAKMDIAWISRRIRNIQGLDEVTQRASAMSGLIDDSIQTVKRIAAELRPGILDDAGLAAAIEWLARTFERSVGVYVLLHLDFDDANVPKGPQTALFRIVQESLTNVGRHAAASRVEISLISHEAGVKLTIRDNGRGILTDYDRERSFGILGMRERIAALDGQFILNSKPGEGTLITVILPLQAAGTQ
ncbi:MAG: diguanylate cyclase/phosphodiesterase & domain with sensor(s) [Acidobacteriaceae bacterium]|nr:diguanylate cyclase/phosphodiesterase & domain with sensor(s) [Acidobacteriaceae bacterium]